MLFECWWWLNGNLFWKFNEWKTKSTAGYALNNFLAFVFNYKPIKCRQRSNRLLIESVKRAQRFNSIFRQRFFFPSLLLYVCQNTKANILQQWYMKIQTQQCEQQISNKIKIVCAGDYNYDDGNVWKRNVLHGTDYGGVWRLKTKTKHSSSYNIFYLTWIIIALSMYTISKHILSKINNAMLLCTAACVCECVFNCLFTISNKCLPLLLHHFLRLNLHSLSLPLSYTHTQTLTCSDFQLVFIRVCFFIPFSQATLCASCNAVVWN